MSNYILSVAIKLFGLPLQILVISLSIKVFGLSDFGEYAAVNALTALFLIVLHGGVHPWAVDNLYKNWSDTRISGILLSRIYFSLFVLAVCLISIISFTSIAGLFTIYSVTGLTVFAYCCTKYMITLLTTTLQCFNKAKLAHSTVQLLLPLIILILIWLSKSTNMFEVSLMEVMLVSNSLVALILLLSNWKTGLHRYLFNGNVSFKNIYNIQYMLLNNYNNIFDRGVIYTMSMFWEPNIVSFYSILIQVKSVQKSSIQVFNQFFRHLQAASFSSEAKTIPYKFIRLTFYNILLGFIITFGFIIFIYYDFDQQLFTLELPYIIILTFSGVITLRTISNIFVVPLIKMGYQTELALIFTAFSFISLVSSYFLITNSLYNGIYLVFLEFGISLYLISKGIKHVNVK